MASSTNRAPNFGGLADASEEKIDMSPSGSVEMPSLNGPVLPAHWRTWVAENVILNKDRDLMLQAMVREGVNPTLAVREIDEASEHPYVQAAKKVVTLSPGASESEPKLRKRDWILSCYRRTAQQSSTFAVVPRVPKLSRQEFFDEYYALNRPVVIEGAMANWPALTRWTGAELKRRMGTRIVEVQANRETDSNYEQNQARHHREMPFGEFIDIIETASQTNNWYMTANNSGKNCEPSESFGTISFCFRNICEKTTPMAADSFGSDQPGQSRRSTTT